MDRRLVATPFLRRGTGDCTRAEFVYTLTGDTGWFTPDEAEEVVERGVEEGLLDEDDGSLSPTFDTDNVELPDEKPVVHDDRGTFDRVVERLVDEGWERRGAVAEINAKHAAMGDVRVEAAALVVARYEGIDVSGLAREELDGMKQD